MYDKIVMNSGRSKDAPEKLKMVYINADGEVVKTNRGTSLEEAGPNVMRHLQRNHYGAAYAEVLDADTEQLFFAATAKWATRKGKSKWCVEGVYEWNPEDTERKYGVSALLEQREKQK